jgi:hypothetical protein
MLDDKDVRIRGLEATIVEKDSLCKELVMYVFIYIYIYI